MPRIAYFTYLLTYQKYGTGRQTRQAQTVYRNLPILLAFNRPPLILVIVTIYLLGTLMSLIAWF